MGCCFGFKLHLVCNDKGEIIDFMFTPANLSDRFLLKEKKFHDKLFGGFSDIKLILVRAYLKNYLWMTFTL